MKPKLSPLPWNVGNWDQVTLAWLKSPEGAADAKLIANAQKLLHASKHLLKAARSNGKHIEDTLNEAIALAYIAVKDAEDAK